MSRYTTPETVRADLDNIIDPDNVHEFQTVAVGFLSALAGGIVLDPAQCAHLLTAHADRIGTSDQ